jgi:hypothetical protein
MAKINAFRILVERPDAKRPLWRLTCTWADNIETDINKMGYDSVHSEGSSYKTSGSMKAGNFLVS